jgi:hypothetical protein
LLEQKEVAAGVVREAESTELVGVGLGDGVGDEEPDISTSHSLT